ncbi:MAG: ice-binding family protein [Gemmatimonadales bacterium]
MRLFLAVALIAGFSASCDPHEPTAAGSIASLTVTPDTTLALGDAAQFIAVARDADGVVLAIAPTWSVVAGGGTINAGSGFFTAGTIGVFPNTVRATFGGLSDSASVTVNAGVLASITVTPDPQTLVISTTQTFTAVYRNTQNAVIPSLPAPVWSVVSGGGTVNAGSGLFTAGTVPGTYTNTVRATSGAIFGDATVLVTAGALASLTVTPDPDTLFAGASGTFTAVGRDASNNIVPVTVTWSVVNGGGTINSGTGRFTAGGVAGTFTNTVRAVSGIRADTATVVVLAVGGPVIPMGLTAPYGIMAGLSFTCITNGLIQADIAISPGSTVTGFPPCIITGTQQLANAVALNAQNDLTTLYNTLFGLPCPPANAIVADLGGTTKPAGVYCTASSIAVSGTLTLDGGGDANALFVFQAGTSLVTAGDIVLINGAQAKNVYWQVGSSATLGTASQFKGNIVALTSITLVDTANLIGRALARNGSVSLGNNNVITLP